MRGDGWNELEAKHKNPDSFNVFDSPDSTKATHEKQGDQSVVSKLSSWQEELKKRESGSLAAGLSLGSLDDF